MTTKKKELTERIIAITEEIYENYPELAEFVSEMTETLPTSTDPDVDSRRLQQYYDSLIEMTKKYKKNRETRDQKRPMKGVKIIRSAGTKQT